MSQLIACLAPTGLLLASDRRVEVREEGGIRVESKRKLFPLGTAAAIATGGAAVGIGISGRLSSILAPRGALPLHEIELYVMDVFQREYDAFVAKGRAFFDAHPEALRRACVLLGGRDREGRPAFRFYVSEEHGEPFRSVEVGAVLAMPRRLGLEMRLVKAGAEGLRRAEEEALAGLRLIAKKEEAVAAPFDFAYVEGGQMRLVTKEE